MYNINYEDSGGMQASICSIFKFLNNFLNTIWITISVQFSHSVLSNSLQPPLTTACQAFLSITNSQSPPKPMSIESVMSSSHLILCRPLLLLPSIFPSIRVFSNESAVLHQVAKVLEFQLQHRPSNEHPGLYSFRIDCWISLQSKGLLVFSNITFQKHQFF